jgi:hypothetical protein
MATSEPRETTKVVRASLEQACKEFTARICDLGFQRTKKIFWARRQPFTVDFINLVRSGSSYGAPLNFSVSINVHFGIRVLNDDFPAPSPNGPSTDAARIRAGRYHLRFNAETGSTFDRCIDDLVRFVVDEGEPWFKEFHSVEALLRNPHSPLRTAEKQSLAAAVAGSVKAANVTSSLKMLGIE